MLRHGPAPSVAALVTVLVCVSSVARFRVVDAGHSELHSFDHGERVGVLGVQVGPLSNPFQKYDFFSLPYCVPGAVSPEETSGTKKRRRSSSSARRSLYDVMMGVTRTDLGLDVRFGIDSPVTEICSVDMSVEPVFRAFQRALHGDFWMELSVDDLPVYAFVGQPHGSSNHSAGPARSALVLHTQFNFMGEINEDQIVGFRLEMKKPVLLEQRGSVTFTYAVHWTPSKRKFTERFGVFLDARFYQNSSHLMALVNAFFLGLILVGVVSLLLYRSLRSDRENYHAFLDGETYGAGHPSAVTTGGAAKHFARQPQFAAPELLDLRDTDVGLQGWRSIHGDVFRAPPHTEFFAALIGNGVFLLFVFTLAIIATIAGELYTSMHSLFSVFAMSAALGVGVSGYFSGGLYQRSGQKRWIRAMVLTMILIPSILILFLFVVPWIAARGLESPAVFGALFLRPSMTQVLVLLCFLLLVYLPLQILGTMAGRVLRGVSNNPCALNALPRPIDVSKQPWWSSPALLIPVSAALPFSVVFVEVYYLIVSFWNYKYYFVFDLALVVLGMSIVVISSTSIVTTYLLLQAEDYRWPWVSYSCGAWSGMYVFLYAIYVFFVETQSPSRMLSASRLLGGGDVPLDDALAPLRNAIFISIVYISQCALFSSLFSIMAGAIAYVAASVFVRSLYKSLKTQ
ncbi:Transmembrane 9 superfamily member 3 [Porphyridium purpureum]|uniref:Transmembrane 9 superfamily member n=1 Tax=Porphyridium purpureum TaxID=35688 RepID=A0A5J4Z6X6_PORPP|nr:Transmembrane 9 superfamily member 3 [Porphyridium purpureum]|eukprot:POR1027..scf295_1